MIGGYSDIVGHYKSINGYYVQFGDVEHQENKPSVWLEIKDWVKSRDSQTEDLYTALGINNPNQMVVGGRSFVELQYPAFVRLSQSDNINESEFYDLVSRRIMAHSIAKKNSGLYQMNDMKPTKERWGLIRNFKIPITIVQNIV